MNGIDSEFKLKYLENMMEKFSSPLKLRCYIELKLQKIHQLSIAVRKSYLKNFNCFIMSRLNTDMIDISSNNVINFFCMFFHN